MQTSIGISVVVTASVYSEKIRMKKLMMIIIIVYIIIIIIGERAKRARHSQVCSIENRICNSYTMVERDYR